MTRKIILAALMSGAAIGLCLPAQAMTGNQYASQGQGVYTTSKGMPEGYHRPYRGYRTEQQYRRVYRPPVYVPDDEDDYDPDAED